jgi:hypothetical protein
MGGVEEAGETSTTNAVSRATIEPDGMLSPQRLKE